MSFVIHHGDALAVLRTLPEASVNCCITSPPYWGLRDYGTATWEGGETNCGHVKGMARGDTERETPGGRGGSFQGGTIQFTDRCKLCGAVRRDSQLGMESTPAEYVSKMVQVFREVRRVLRDDGTLWLNMGDSYAGSWGSQGRQGNGAIQGRSAAAERQIAASAKKAHRTGAIPEASGLKPKDLIGIPWRVALALQADGWWLRSDIIWHKPNPMPESVTDRPTKAHEYIFLLAKSERYYYAADEIREPASYLQANAPDAIASPYGQGFTRRAKGNGKTFRGGGAYTGNRSFNNSVPVERESHGNEPNESLTRNKRSVWTLATLPTPEAHFATFPIELPEICLKAGCPEGGTVLDPFAGAGTTGLACLKNGRNFVGIELKREYIDIAHARAWKYYPLLATQTTPEVSHSTPEATAND